MVYKKYSNKRQSRKKMAQKPPRRKRRKNKRPKRLNKSQFKQISLLIDKKIDLSVEDKFKLDSSFTDNSASGWDATTKTMFLNMTPTIAVGTAESQRIGLKVKMKQMRIQIRMLPSFYSTLTNTENTTDNLSITRNLFRNFPPVNVYFVSIPRETHETTSNAELRAALKIKFKPSGYYRQDFLSSTEQKTVKAIKLISKCQLKQKFKNLSVYSPTFPILGGGDSGDGVQVLNVPQIDNAVISHKFNQSWLFENSTNSPAKLTYYLYAEFSNKWYNPSYDGQIDRPTHFDTRSLFTYEDS